LATPPPLGDEAQSPLNRRSTLGDFDELDRGESAWLDIAVMKIQQGDVLSYHEMCQIERTALQRGMNFRPAGRRSVILMSRRRDAPYADRIQDGGRVLIYEGHDQPARKGGPDPKTVDQPDRTPQGRATQTVSSSARPSSTVSGRCTLSSSGSTRS